MQTEPPYAASPATQPASGRLTACFRAVRPGFLMLTAIACAVGLVTSLGDGKPLLPAYALATLVLALLTHAAVNVYNDCGDAVIGTDAINDARVEPFTGGSRVIQNGELTLAQMYRLASALALAAVLGGLVLAALRGAGLLAIGLFGGLIGWSYSQPGVALMSRGIGELAVALGWALVVVGADYVQRGSLAWAPLAASISLALLVAAVLLINQVPDIDADTACGKRTLAVRIGAQSALAVYGALMLFAYAWVLCAAWAHWLPVGALWALGSLPCGVYAWWLGLSSAARGLPLPRSALLSGVLQANLHGILLATGIGFAFA